MKYNITFGRKIFLIFTYVFLCVFAGLCLLPMVHIFAISLSKSSAAAANLVSFWPVEFSLKSYEYCLKKQEFIRSILVSIERLALGVPVNIFLTTLMAYPLSKERNVLSFRKAYVVFLIITMYFSGGLIPTYMVVKMSGLIDSIFALILPSAVPVFNIIIMLNFFRGIPKEIEEAAYIDGASHWCNLWKIYIPLSKPVLATLVLFCAVGHWNSWFDGIIYMNRTYHYPLQTYLQTVVVQPGLFEIHSLSEAKALAEVSDRTTKAAQIFIGAIPILMVYPFLQKYFMTGIVLGSVKG